MNTSFRDHQIIGLIIYFATKVSEEKNIQNNNEDLFEKYDKKKDSDITTKYSFIINELDNIGVVKSQFKSNLNDKWNCNLNLKDNVKKNDWHFLARTNFIWNKQNYYSSSITEKSNSLQSSIYQQRNIRSNYPNDSSLSDRQSVVLSSNKFSTENNFNLSYNQWNKFLRDHHGL